MAKSNYRFYFRNDIIYAILACPLIPLMKIKPILLQIFLLSLCFMELKGDPVRVLFLGHESEHHNSDEYYPMLAQL